MTSQDLGDFFSQPAAVSKDDKKHARIVSGNAGDFDPFAAASPTAAEVAASTDLSDLLGGSGAGNAPTNTAANDSAADLVSAVKGKKKDTIEQKQPSASPPLAAAKLDASVFSDLNANASISSNKTDSVDLL
jgi:hypothetical protein